MVSFLQVFWSKFSNYFSSEYNTPAHLIQPHGSTWPTVQSRYSKVSAVDPLVMYLLLRA
jgi:hypothetical protein